MALGRSVSRGGPSRLLTGKLAFDPRDRASKRCGLLVDFSIIPVGSSQLADKGLPGAFIKIVARWFVGLVETGDRLAQERIVVGRHVGCISLVCRFRCMNRHARCAPASANWRGIQDTTVGPKLIDTARNAKPGFDSDSPVINLSIVTDEANDADQPIIRQPHLFAEISIVSDQPAKVRLRRPE